MGAGSGFGSGWRSGGGRRRGRGRGRVRLRGRGGGRGRGRCWFVSAAADIELVGVIDLITLFYFESVVIAIDKGGCRGPCEGTILAGGGQSLDLFQVGGESLEQFDGDGLASAACPSDSHRFANLNILRKAGERNALGNSSGNQERAGKKRFHHMHCLVEI
ncbi:hypothetical protein I7I48_00894 [Histoplasma ohiense]|nr:hypothetical protein I7I48_00894 [Histoplasma ohiense (nom. inval.)]